MRLALITDIELGSTRVATGVSHREGSGLMLLAVDLAIDLVAGAACSGHSLRTVTAVGATALSHETRNDAMEGEPVVKAILGQFHEVGDGIGSISLEQLELDLARFGIHQSLGHRGASKIEV